MFTTISQFNFITVKIDVIWFAPDQFVALITYFRISIMYSIFQEQC